MIKMMINQCLEWDTVLYFQSHPTDFPIEHDCHLCLRGRRDEHLPNDNDVSFFVISIVAAILQLFFVVCLGRLRSLPTNKWLRLGQCSHGVTMCDQRSRNSKTLWRDLRS